MQALRAVADGAELVEGGCGLESRSASVDAMSVETDDGGSRVVACPCGARIEAGTRDELVERLREHLEADHPRFCPSLWSKPD